MAEVAAPDVRLSTVRMTDGASFGALPHPNVQRSDNSSDPAASCSQHASPSGAAAKPSESRANQRNQLRSSKMIESTGDAGAPGHRGLFFLHPANKSFGRRSFPAFVSAHLEHVLSKEECSALFWLGEWRTAEGKHISLTICSISAIPGDAPSFFHH